MPAYPWLFEMPLDGATVEKRMRALRSIGVPYSDTDIAGAASTVAGKTQGDALVAYLLKLGRDRIQK